MSTAPQLNPILSLYACLPWGLVQLDQSAVRNSLNLAQIGPGAALGAALTEALGQRMRECRDFTSLRGVHAKRGTVLQMAGRSLARDDAQIARFDLLTEGRGAALLQALAGFIDAQSSGAATTSSTTDLADLVAFVATLTAPDGEDLDTAETEPSSQAANDETDRSRGGPLAA
jgi:hypothetical protein